MVKYLNLNLCKNDLKFTDFEKKFTVKYMYKA